MPIVSAGSASNNRVLARGWSMLMSFYRKRVAVAANRAETTELICDEDR